MEQNELIHNLIDGSLDNNHEEQLFLTLVSSEEARSELKQQIAIKNAIRADKMAYTPRVQSTLNVFNTLGFTPPSLVAIPMKTGFGNSFLKLVQTYSQGLIGGLIATVATSFVFFTFISPEAKNSSNNADNKVISKNIEDKGNNLPINKTTSVAANANNIISNNSNSKNNRITKTPNLNFIKNDKQVSSVEAELTNNQVNTQIPDNKLQENVVQLDMSNLFNAFNSKNNVLDYNSMPVNEAIQMKEQKYNDMPFLNNSNNSNLNNFSIEFRKSEVWFSQNPTIYPKNLAAFNNSSLAIMYDISKEFAAGFDLRQETFFQKFNHDSSGYNLQFEQQPNLTSGGVFLRWQPEFISFWNINPLLQTTLSANEAGYVMRGMFGLSFSPYNGITFVGGYEYSNLLFSHNNNNSLTSSKYNLNYGIKFNF